MAASSDPEALSAAFCELEAIDTVSTSGAAGAKVVTHSGLPVDLRIVPEEAFGNLLQHFTGSGRHNEALRTDAVRRGLHVSEYGITDDESGTSEAFTTEEEVYDRLGMAFIPPELRENRGELEAARKGELPKLIEQGDLRGDLHMHTTLSDGRNSLEEMVAGARELGYEYVAITEHSASHGFGDDVQPDALQGPHRGGPLARRARHPRARRHRDQHHARRHARLRRRAARSARLGGREPAHVIPALGEQADRAHAPGDGAPARRRDRAPDRTAAREPRALPARHRQGDREGGRDGHVPRDQLESRPA